MISKRENNRRIPLALYKKIIGSVPILTVDIIIVHQGKVLLHKRANEPYKGFWWTPGGRVLLGESSEQAAVRKVREEVGLRVKLGEIIGILNAPERRWGIGSQTISVVYKAYPINMRQKVVLDSQSTDFGWFQKIPPHTQKDLRKLLRKAGFG